MLYTDSDVNLQSSKHPRSANCLIHTLWQVTIIVCKAPNYPRLLSNADNHPAAVALDPALVKYNSTSPRLGQTDNQVPQSTSPSPKFRILTNPALPQQTYSSTATNTSAGLAAPHLFPSPMFSPSQASSATSPTKLM